MLKLRIEKVCDKVLGGVAKIFPRRSSKSASKMKTFDTMDSQFDERYSSFPFKIFIFFKSSVLLKSSLR